MSKKDKAKRHQAQKQKKALQKARRAASMKKAPPKSSKVTEAMFPNERMAFWAAHGINYILSDYDTGTWTPLFDSIYDGTPVTLTPEEVSNTLTLKFGAPYDRWPLTAQTALVWMMQKRDVMYVYAQNALDLLRKNDPVCDAETLATQPHNGIVWEMFSGLGKKIAADHFLKGSPESDQSVSDPPEVGSIGDKTPAP